MASLPPGATQTVVVAPPKVTWKDMLPVISLLIVIIGVVLAGGKAMGQVGENTRRIETLEHRADQRDDQLRDMQAKIAGMDAKLDLLLSRLKGDNR